VCVCSKSDSASLLRLLLLLLNFSLSRRQPPKRIDIFSAVGRLITRSLFAVDVIARANEFVSGGHLRRDLYTTRPLFLIWHHLTVNTRHYTYIKCIHVHGKCSREPFGCRPIVTRLRTRIFCTQRARTITTIAIVADD